MINDFEPDDLIDIAIKARLYDLKVCLPGVVQAYDAAAQTVDVLPVGGTYQDGTAVAWPVLPDVPVAVMRFGGGYFVTPLALGDPVTLVFSSRALDGWAQDGIADDPQSPRFGHLADAIALPMGVVPAASRLTGLPTLDVVLTEATGGQVLLGAGASLAAARATDPVNVTTAWAAWFATVGGFIGTPPPSAAPTFDPELGTIASGSAVVKIGG